MSKNQERLLTIRVYVRTKDVETAERFAQAVRGQVESMARNYLKHKVSLTGTGAEVESL